MSPEDFYTIYLQYPQICTDSRRAEPGCLFFALRGDQFDGNRFAADALAKGCQKAVVDDPAAVAGDDYILVSDTLRFLQELAGFHRSKLNMPVIALTGTNGKTTTKELIFSVLSRKFNTLATSGNLNNHIGVPLTILRASLSTEILVVEMGANHPGEIASLCRIARPTHGLITNIGKAHLEGFGSFEGVIKAKKELFDYLKESGGKLFLNSDDSLLLSLAGNYPVKTYGTGPEASVRGQEIPDRLKLNLRWENPSGNRPMAIRSNLTGSFHLQNILAAIAIGSFFGVRPEQVKIGIESYQPENLRSQWIHTGANQVLLDAYNANPTSLSLAVKSFAKLRLDRKVLILGDMFELGEASASEHREIIRLVGTLGFKTIFLAGQAFYSERGGYPYNFFPDRNSLEEFLKLEPLEGCHILVKGSRGMQLEKLVDYL